MFEYCISGSIAEESIVVLVVEDVHVDIILKLLVVHGVYGIVPVGLFPLLNTPCLAGQDVLELALSLLKGVLRPHGLRVLAALHSYLLFHQCQVPVLHLVLCPPLYHLGEVGPLLPQRFDKLD